MPFTTQKNLIRIFTVSFVMLAFFSCKKETSLKTTSSANAVTAQTQKDSNFVNLNLAATSAKQASNSHLISDIIAKQTISGLNIPVAKQILDTLAVPDSANPSFYIFNYTDGGYIIITADRRIEPILAYSNNGYFAHSGNLAGGLLDWMILNHLNIQVIRKNANYKASAKVNFLWKELLTQQQATPTKKTVDNLDNNPPPCQPTSSDVIVGPLLGTEWGQGYPYNTLCPPGTYDASNNVPTGCEATAIAQVMNYWKYPTTYNWSIMPVNYYNGLPNAEVARLMHDVGLSVNMQYNNAGSGAFAKDAPTALTNTFHYSSALFGNYDVGTVLANLNSNEPILLSGDNTKTTNTQWLFWTTTTYSDGHEWVCDGYNEAISTTCPTYNPNTGDIITPGVYTNTILLHMNWGWADYGISNNGNGWFNYDQWAITNGPAGTLNFQYQQSMTYNIHP